MKCVLMTRDEAEVFVGSFVVAAAILVMEIEEVLVASMALEGQISASLANIDFFKSGISGTASMTKSTSERSSIFVVGCSRDFVSLATSCVILDFETSFSRSLSANSMALSSEAWELSTRVTGTPAFCAATIAIPRPWSHQYLKPNRDQQRCRTICPAPITPSFFTSKAIVRGDEENWRVKADNLAAEAFLLAVDKSILMCSRQCLLLGVPLIV